MTKEPNFLLSPTLCYLYVFSNNLSRLLPIFTVLQRGDERQKNRRDSISTQKVFSIWATGRRFNIWKNPGNRLPGFPFLFVFIGLPLRQNSHYKRIIRTPNCPRCSYYSLVAGMNRAMSNCTPFMKRQNIYWFRLFAYKMILLFSLWKSVKNDCFSMQVFIIEKVGVSADFSLDYSVKVCYNIIKFMWRSQRLWRIKKLPYWIRKSISTF